MKKSIVLLLCSALLLSSVLASCASDTPASAKTNNGSSAAVSSESDTETEPAVEELLPQMNFEGREANFYLRLTSTDWSADDVLSEGQDGTSINDAVYERNIYIEDKYNLKLTGVYADGTSGSVYNPVSKAVLAGDSSYDIVTSDHFDAAKFMLEGLILNLKELDYIDLDRPWWNPVLNKTISMANKQYYATGDISRVDNLGIRCFFFNKDMAKDIGLENPYTLVEDNNWTYAKLFELATAGTRDLDGDGSFTDADSYGITAQSTLGMVLAYAGGVSVTDKDENDIPNITIDSEQSITVLDTVKNYINKNPDIHYSDVWLNTQKRFSQNQTLFQAEVMLLIEVLRASEVDIGILPAPKYNEEQENYIHYLDANCVVLYSVPTTASDPDFSAFVLEAMAEKSQDTLTVAFYDICLNGKYLRDEESSRMLDIIFSSYRMDNADGFGWGNMYGSVSTALKSGSDVASVIEKNKGKLEEYINDSIEKLSALV